MIKRSIGISRSGLSVLKKIGRVRIDILFIEIELLDFHLRSCRLTGVRRRRRCGGGLDGGQSGEKEEGQRWEWGFHIKDRASPSVRVCCLHKSVGRRPEVFAGAKLLVPSQMDRGFQPVTFITRTEPPSLKRLTPSFCGM